MSPSSVSARSTGSAGSSRSADNGTASSETPSFLSGLTSPVLLVIGFACSFVVFVSLGQSGALSGTSAWRPRLASIISGDGQQQDTDLEETPPSTTSSTASGDTQERASNAPITEDNDSSEADAEVDDSTPEPARKHVALAFYGLTRSLSYTIGSIEKHIFAPLQAAGHTFDVYLHTYDLDVIQGGRSEQQNTALNTTEWQLLQPDVHSITNQASFLREYKLQIKACETFQLNKRKSASSKDPWNDHFSSVEHLLCQLNSIAEVTHLWRSSDVEYDAVAFLRPDVLFNCDFPVDALEALPEHTAVIPDFHHWRDGWNDRFLLAKPDVAEIWGDRLVYALGVCTMYDLHAESIVRRVLERHSIEVQPEPFFFYRVRADGSFSYLDVEEDGSEIITQCNHDEVVEHLARVSAEQASEAGKGGGAAGNRRKSNQKGRRRGGGRRLSLL